MDLTPLRMPAAGLEAIIAHARFSLPNECCGLLAGSSHRQVRFVYPLSNSNPSPTSYTIEPYEHYRALLHAEGLNFELVGAFHSHPGGPPHPSPTDMRLATEPDWTHLIVTEQSVRAFVLDRDRFEEIRLIVT